MPPRPTKQKPTGMTPTSQPSNGHSAWDMAGGLKVLAYGQSGTGKTTFWATFPGRTLVLVCSGGKRPGELRSIDTPENRKRIDARIVSSVEQLNDWITEAEDYDNTVLDHVSGLQDQTMKEILGIEALPEQKGWGLATQQQWGQSTAQCKEILRALLSLPGNVVIVGQERVFGGGDDASVSDIIHPTVGVGVTPSLAGWLHPAVDYAMQFFKRPRIVEKQVSAVKGQPPTTIRERGKGVEYCARCEPHDVFYTKFRLPKGRTVPDVIVDPTYDKLMAVINGGK